MAARERQDAGTALGEVEKMTHPYARSGGAGDLDHKNSRSGKWKPVISGISQAANQGRNIEDASRYGNQLGTDLARSG